MMESLGQGYRAVVIGASGGIGGALARALAADPACACVHALARGGPVPAGPRIRPGRIDLTEPASIARAAGDVAREGGPQLVIVAAGWLHDGGRGPEKRWEEIGAGSLARSFAVNATGPALAAAAFLPTMPRRERAMFAALSARVGSISDNRAGGWYGYRASKAALNQILRTLAIEAARRAPGLVIAGLQPGTVETGLSAPFRGGGGTRFDADTAAGHLLAVLDGLSPAQSGRVFDWRGAEVPP